MKRTTALALALLVASARLAAAQDTAPAAQAPSDSTATDEPPAAVFDEDALLSCSAIAGVSWSQRYHTGDTTLNLIADAIAALRGGAGVDAMLRVMGPLRAGPELGLYYMTGEITLDETTIRISLIDIATLAKLSLGAGMIRAEAVAGALFTFDGATVEDLVVGANVMAGSRLFLGSVYAEFDYVVRLGATPVGERSSYARFALGYALRLL